MSRASAGRLHAGHQSRSRYFALGGRVLIASMVAIPVSRHASAQANIPQFRGDLGLSAGTQAPPGWSVELFYNNYHASHVNDSDGNFLQPIRTTVNALVVTAEYSSEVSILGGRWSAIVSAPWVSRAVAASNLEGSSMWGFADMYFLPLQLGWKIRHGDILFGQGVFAPTGRYDTGSHNTGLGMWSYESTLGGTAYLDGARRTSLSTLASYQIQSNVRDSNRRAGQVLTIEGGAGQSIPALRGQVGAVYYARFKTTPDQNYPLPPQFAHKDNYYGVGPEITGVVPGRSLLTTLTARYFFEIGNRNAPDGNSLYLLATVSTSSAGHR